MPKYRKFHTKATESIDINDMPDDFTRLLWVMLPLGLDSQGRAIDNPAWVKSKIMPLRVDVSLEMIENALQWYSDRGMTERYVVDGRRFFWVPTFPLYQGSTNKEAESFYPAPPEPEPEQVETKPDAEAEQPETAPEPIPELVQSKSGVSPEPVQGKSSTDVDSDSDSDSDSRKEAGKKPALPRKSKSKKPTSGKKPKLSDHPAIQTYRAAALRFPHKSTWAEIIKIVGEERQDLEFWFLVVKKYIALGWKPTNVDNQLALFKEKKLPTTNIPNGANKNGSSQQNLRPTKKPDKEDEYRRRLKLCEQQGFTEAQALDSGLLPTV